jgi:hypothetical protein
MKTLKLAALAATMVFASAMADETDQGGEREMKIQVMMTGDGGDDATTINWTSSDPNMDLHNMQIGESRSIVDDSGRAILVTKVEEGLRFDVDGKSVVMPDVGTHAGYATFASLDGNHSAEENFDVAVVGAGHAMATPVVMAGPPADGVTIITREPLDAATQESIRAVLMSAGHDDEVSFIAGGSATGAGNVRVIQRQVEVVQ